MITTNESLLGRLRADNAQEAWREFFEIYWGVILRYARKLGLRPDQADDVLQETMVILMRALPEFVYDRRRGRFRNFLLTIVHRRALAAIRREAGKPEVAWSDQHAETEGPIAAEGVGRQESLARWHDSLLEEAIRRLRLDQRLGEDTFAIFEAYVIQREPAETVARRFRVRENVVYQIRNRILRRLKREVERLRVNGGEKLEDDTAG